MGVPGMRRWLDDHKCTAAFKGRTPVAHLCFDMNALLHLSFDPRDPTVGAFRRELFRNLTKTLDLMPPGRSISVCFDGPAPVAKLPSQRDRRRKQHRPSHSAATPVDQRMEPGMLTTGCSFMSKVAAEVFSWFSAWVREQRAKVHPQGEEQHTDAEAADIYSTHVTRPGGAPVELFFSGPRVPGEGETKIAQRLLDLCRRPEGTPLAYVSHDSIGIIGNDTDLVLCALLCTPYHNLFVVNPQSHLCTSVGDLMRGWLSDGTGGRRGCPGAPRLTLEQLAAARVDFAFLTYLRGCDHFPGIDNAANPFWHEYRRRRAPGATRHADGLVAGRGGVCVVPSFLREVVAPAGGKQRGGSAAAGSGTKYQQARRAFEARKKQQREPRSAIALLEGVLWVLRCGLEGMCPDVRYVHRGEATTFDALKTAVLQSGLGEMRSASATSWFERNQHGKLKKQSVAVPVTAVAKPAPSPSAAPEECKAAHAADSVGEPGVPSRSPAEAGPSPPAAAPHPLRPLECYVAVTPHTAALPRAVRELLEKQPHLHKRLGYDSPAAIAEAAAEAVGLIDRRLFTAAERAELDFDEPRLLVFEPESRTWGQQPWAPPPPGASFLEYTYPPAVLATGLAFRLPGVDGTLTAGAPAHGAADKADTAADCYPAATDEASD